VFNWTGVDDCAAKAAAIAKKQGQVASLQRFFPDRAYDRHFASDVQYARHLQSIDEGRKDFKRVPWGGSGTVKWPDRQGEPEQFDQIWFAGNHADIGGSYPENESRLSDITLAWMVEFITDKIPEAGRVVVDKTLLRLYPSADGMMHDECMVGIGGTAFHWSKAVRDVPDTAQLHELRSLQARRFAKSSKREGVLRTDLDGKGSARRRERSK
jgi:Uncharacterized alpha/beta hydrolase domain (DUF2235)